MELMAKDVRLALQEAEALGLVMPTSRAAQMLYGLAMAGVVQGVAAESKDDQGRHRTIRRRIVPLHRGLCDPFGRVVPRHQGIR